MAGNVRVPGLHLRNGEFVVRHDRATHPHTRASHQRSVGGLLDPRRVCAQYVDRLASVYGVYLQETREVWVPRVGDTAAAGLAAAPSDLRGFVELGEAIVRSPRIASYLSQEK